MSKIVTSWIVALLTYRYFLKVPHVEPKWTLVYLLRLYSTGAECLEDTWSYRLFKGVTQR